MIYDDDTEIERPRKVGMSYDHWKSTEPDDSDVVYHETWTAAEQAARRMVESARRINERSERARRSMEYEANPAIAALFEACPDHEICPRCGCCDLTSVCCDSCGGDGFVGSDDEWDDDFSECDTCDGEGGWESCLGRCDKDGVHTKE
jgi:hypothetical protein